MTELGRRIGILAGAIAFISCVATGIITNSDLVMSTVYAIIGALAFGGGGYLIGYMVEGYIAKAFKRDLAKQIIEKDIAEAEKRASRESVEPYEGEEEDLSAASA